MEEIKDRIIQLRKQLKLSQENFGKQIGLSKSGISNIENGTRTISNTHIKIICSTFGVSETWLRTGKELAKTIKELEYFIDYLKSIGYVYSYDVNKVIDSHVEDMIDNDGNIIGQDTIIDDAEYSITLSKDNITSKFTEEEFQELQKKSKENIEGTILLQNLKNKELKSAATDDNSK